MSQSAELLVVGVLTAAVGVGPGFFFVRRLRWSGLETLCASVGVSCVLLYLLALLVRTADFGSAGRYAGTGVLLALTVASSRSLWAFARRRSVGRVLGWFGGLVGVGVGLLALMRHHSGAGWAYDYWEHYERCQFFLGQLPLGHKYIGLYAFPARPPLMNAAGSVVLGDVADSFAAFQVVFLLLSLVVYFPLVLLAQMIAPRVARSPARVTVLLALSPVLWQNATFSWTKLFSGFYVLFALALYVRGWQKSDPWRVGGAFLSLTAGVLVHYSAAVFALFLSLHYGYQVLRRRRSWREVAGTGLASTLLMASWIGWSVAAYGPRTTFGSNTTVSDSAALTWRENLNKIGRNVLTTLVPHPARMAPSTFVDMYWQPSALGLARDYWFAIAQTSVVTMMGCVGGAAVLGLLTRERLWRGQLPPPVRWFWILFLPWSVLTGIAVVGTFDLFGLGHICLQPLTLLGITYLGVRFPALPLWVRLALVAGAATDWSLGVLTHFHVQRFVAPAPAAGGWVLNPALPSEQAIVNLAQRNRAHASYFGDLFAGVAPALEIAVLVMGAALVYRLARTDLRAPGRTVRAPAAVALLAVSGLAGVYLWCQSEPTRDAAVSREELSRAGRGVREQPDSVRAHTTAARALYAEKGWSAGRPANCTALLLNPTDHEARYFIELALLMAPADEQTTFAYGVADRVRSVPGDPDAWAALGAVLLLSGHREPAARAMAEVDRLSGRPEAGHESAADYLMRFGRSGPAVEVYEAGLNVLGPADTEPRRRLLDKVREARRQLDAATAKKPGEHPGLKP